MAKDQKKADIFFGTLPYAKVQWVRAHYSSGKDAKCKNFRFKEDLFIVVSFNRFADHATVPPLAAPLAQVVGARYFPSGATLGAR